MINFWVRYLNTMFSHEVFCETPTVLGKLSLSENHLLRNFSQIFHISPFQYITQLKIAEAKRQIIETDKNITEIASTLGYSSLSNFSYYFKNLVGLSPVTLRKKVRYRK